MLIELPERQSHRRIEPEKTSYKIFDSDMKTADFYPGIFYMLLFVICFIDHLTYEKVYIACMTMTV